MRVRYFLRDQHGSRHRARKLVHQEVLDTGSRDAIP